MVVKNPLHRSDLRIVVMDLEASALGRGSYPIEIGIATITGMHRPIDTCSTLIAPDPGWIADGLWSDASQRLHGIGKDDLSRHGLSIQTVCASLNELLRRNTLVVTDAPMFDQSWLDTLFGTAGIEQAFHIYEYDALCRHLDRDQYRQLVHLLDRTPTPHRAGPDAFRLASKLVEAHSGCPAIERAVPFRLHSGDE